MKLVGVIAAFFTGIFGIYQNDSGSQILGDVKSMLLSKWLTWIF